MRRSVVLWFGSAAVFGLALLLLITGPGFEVVGNPDITRESFQVEFVGAFSFTVAPQDRGVANGVDALVQAIFAGIAFVTGLFFRAFLVPGIPRLQSFFAVVAAGAAAMAIDEEFELVETLGYNLRFMAGVPGWEPQDLDEIVWGVLMVGFLWYFRKVILSSRMAAALWGVGAAIFFVGVVSDVVLDAPYEDALETVASCAFMAGFIVLAFDRLVGTLVQDFLDPAAGRGTQPEPRAPAERPRER